MAESEEELKSLLMKGKEENAKAGLKLNTEKTKIVASSPITSQQIDGETMETVTDFIFLGSKITADGECSHEILKDASFLEEKVWPTKKAYEKAEPLLCWKGLCHQSYDFCRKINSEYSSEGLMLKLQYLGHLRQRADSLEKTLMLGKIEGRRRRGR